jgi:hypothetical protein
MVERACTLLRTTAALTLLALVTTTSGCAAPEDDDIALEDDEDGDLHDLIDEGTSELAVAGMWNAPRSVLDAGARPARPLVRVAGRGSGGLLPGTRTLGDEIKRKFPRNIASPAPGLPAVQGYNCRSIRGGGGLSVHATGRALDVFVPKTGGQADNTKGDAIANWLVENARELGVQAVIWDRAAWSVRTKRIGRYTGTHPHNDHVHIELIEDAATKRLAWYRDR